MNWTGLYDIFKPLDVVLLPYPALNPCKYIPDPSALFPGFHSNTSLQVWNRSPKQLPGHLIHLLIELHFYEFSLEIVTGHTVMFYKEFWFIRNYTMSVVQCCLFFMQLILTCWPFISGLNQLMLTYSFLIRAWRESLFLCLVFFCCFVLFCFKGCPQVADIKICRVSVLQFQSFNSVHLCSSRLHKFDVDVQWRWLLYKLIQRDSWLHSD